MASERPANLNKSILLVILMITMTQVGYLDSMNSLTNGEETLDDAEPIAHSSPATSVMYGNNSMWVTGGDAPIKGSEYIALSSDAVLFQGTSSHTTKVGCPMAYNASNYTTWEPNTAPSNSCAGMVGRYVGMVDGITYFTYHPTFSNSQANNDQRGDLHAYNPANDTIYLVSSHNNQVDTAVIVGRTIYIATGYIISGTTSSFFAYNIDNQTTWALPAPTLSASQLMVVGTKIFNYAFTSVLPVNIGSQVFNTANGTWYSVPSLPAKGLFGDPAAGLVSNGQLLFIGSDSTTSYHGSGANGGNGSEYWIYDSNNDTAWPLGDFCTSVVYNNVCDGALRFAGESGLPHVRDGTEMYFIGRSHMTSTANADMYDLWGYSTTNSTHWHMTNLSTVLDRVGTSPYSSGRFAYINLAMLDNGEFVISSRRVPTQNSYESAFYSPNNDTLWQSDLETSDSMGYDVPVQNTRLLGVYGNTVYFVYSSNVVAYNAANQTGVGKNVPGSSGTNTGLTDYLHGAPLLFGSTFAMANQCGHGTAITCPYGYRNTILQWQPESVTVSDAWNLTPGQRIDGPITGGNGIHFNSGIGVQSMTASTDGTSVLLGDTMIPITFEYDAAVANRQLLSNNLGISDQLSCAILENGSVACWGYNLYGQLGNSSSTSTFSSTPELTNPMPGNKLAVALDTSKYIGCALLENGSVACWGWTWNYGEMGDGSQSQGTRAPGLTGSFGTNRSAVEVSTANQGACVLLDNGSVSCWGEGSKGTIGDGGTSHRFSPTPTASLPNGKKAVALTSGHTHHCALLEDGNVACWGSNAQGQLGDNSTTNRNTPTLTQPLGAPAIAIESDYAHTCALLSTGSMVCWGHNAYGQIGSGVSGGDILTPTPVSNITGTVVSMTTSVANTCALMYNNSVICWGDNSYGQIGNGTTSSGTTPDYTSSFAPFEAKLMLDGGGNGSCALVDNGSMYCWGENSQGSIGDGTTNNALTPTLVDTSMTFLTTHITEVASASGCSIAPSLPTGLSIDSSTCTISGVPTAAVDNRTYTVTATINGITFQTSIWLSTAYRNMTPSVDGADLYVGVDMQNITFDTNEIGSSSLAMTFQSTCAIIDNGTVKCWGNNANGRLGNGVSGTVGRNPNDMGDALPVTNLGTGRTATALSSTYKQNYAHTCAVLDDGSVKCWGVNNNGQLGIGSTTSVGTNLDDMGDNLSAVDLGSDRTAVDIASGIGFSCAVLDTGAVKCWGYNYNGQLGIGNTTQMGDNSGEMGDNLPSVDLGTGRTAVAVAAGYNHACAILDNGLVKCWGLNNVGQLGQSSTETAGNNSSNMGDALPFTPLAQGRTAVHIDAGSAHTCVVFDNGSVKCWGSNSKGQLGLGTSSNMGDDTGEMGSHLPFVDLGTGRTAVDLTTMEESTCAVLDNGDVKCWGRNEHGQLGQGVSTGMIGNGANQMGDNLAVTNLGTGSAKAIAIGSGFSHACAVFDNGSLKCWGSNGNPSGSFHGWLGFASTGATVGRSAGEMGDNLPFVNLGTNVGMNGTSFDSCVASPNLPTGVSIDSSTCTISGTTTLESSNQTYTVTAVKNSKYYQGSLWLSSSYLELTPSVEGADLFLDEAMTNITFQYNASAVSGSGGMTNVTGAISCIATPSLPTGLFIDSSTCTISGTPTVETVNDTYEIESSINGITYIGSIWLSASPYGTITSTVEGAALSLGEAMTPITLGYTSHTSLNPPPPVTWEIHPALPAGMSISSGAISGTPSVYANNQTYTVYANQSGYSTTYDLYFSVDTMNAHTVLENQTIDSIGFHPPFHDGTTSWSVSPNLPASLVNNSVTGEITGTVTSTTSNATYTVTATHSDGSVNTFAFNLQSLADYDGDGLANELPSDYDAAEGPTPGLVADTDDDADGLLDTVETNTGTYVDSSNTGTDPLNPDTDGDGICDGPNAVSGVCAAGPDYINGASNVETPVVLLNNSDAGEITPFYSLTGATYGLSPDLPTSMQFDSSNGSIWGTPDMLKTNTTYTMWANLSDGTNTSWTFFLEVLEDFDGDGMPDVLPGDYNATNDPIRTPGLEEDLDDDGDGYNDTAETNTRLYLDGNNTGTDPRDPDTDDDGVCDGPGTVSGVCTAGPDLTPFGPPATVVAVNNTMIPSVPPYYAGSGLTYGYSPDLPSGLTIDPNNGYLMGIPTETTGNITYTVYANDTNGNTYSWDFTIEVLEDSDGDGSPDSLPSDYDGDNDSIRAPPGLTEDLDDDGDGASDLDEIANGTEPLNPDTDGDGLCDGINAVPGVCFAGPDPYPNDPTMPVDTDGDGLPDDDSGWTGPPYADDDDDNDGYPDVSEDACGSNPLDANSVPADMDGDTICDGDDDDKDGDGIENMNETGDTTVPPGSSPINPDTDGDGICDGPESPVTSDCTAGPDMFPLDPSAWEDTDGDGYPNELFPPSTSVPPLEEDTDDDNDGWSDIDEVNCGSDPVDGTDVPVDENGDGICDVLDLDWDDDGIPNTNETDTGVYVDSSDTGTDPWNPDTDGDGFCDGPFAVVNGSEMICAAGPDPFPHDPTLPTDTDGDGLPNELPEDYIGNLVADDDDDNDGYTDAAEDTCGSDSLDNLSMPTDLDGDTICDGDDLDMDGDGIANVDEVDTQPDNADTDGDGVCDGPSAPAMPAGICTAGPDAFPNDPAAWDDTDGDGLPDDIDDVHTTDLQLDTDDDNDGWSDVDEAACGTDSKDDTSTPFDGDEDEICDVLDTQTLGYSINGYESDMFEAYVNQSDFVLIPNLTGMEPGIWTIDPALPAGLSFSGTARSVETGIISGIPTEASPMQNYTITADNGRVNISFTLGLGVLNDFDGDRIPDGESVTGLETDPDDDNDGHPDEIELKCGSDPLNQTSVPDVDEEGNCIEGRYAEDDSDDGTGVLLWCLPLVILLLVLLLLIPLLIRDKVALMGPEPENTTSTPAFMSGNGTKSDPFVLRPIKKLKAGSKAESKEAISITNISPEILVDLLDLAKSNNDKRFMMYEIDGASEESGYKLEADEEGRLRLRFVFDDSANPTYPGAEYEGLLKLGKASVYLSWTVEVKEDKRRMNQIRKEQEAAEKAEKEAKGAQEKAKAEAEAKEAEEKAKAEAEAKAAEDRTAKEAEKKAKAEEKAAATALAKKEKEEAAAKKKQEAAVKKAKAEEKAAAAAAKKAKEEEEAKKKAEVEAKAGAKKKAEKKPAATKEAKKKEELQRVKERAKTIDFKVIGEATSTELKSEVEKGAKTLEVGDASEFAESGSAAITDSKGSTLVSWTGKDGNVLTGVSGVTRVFGAASIVMVKDDLQVIKGIGPFIEEKLNALGITTYRQLANMNAKLEKQVNEAIEFFTGRVKRDQWVAQAKILLGMNAKLDEKALKKAEELERVAQKAEGIDFGVLGVATASEADDLQKIKGIGPFIAEKLNALGIYKFSQLANMTAEIEEEVNVAIEFFPGRVKRDEWAKQAKELAKD